VRGTTVQYEIRQCSVTRYRANFSSVFGDGETKLLSFVELAIYFGVFCLTGWRFPSLYVCRCCRISKTTRPNFTKFSVHVTCGCGSVILWRQWCTLCTCGFVDDVVFPISQNRKYIIHCTAVRGAPSTGHRCVGNLLKFGRVFLDTWADIQTRWSQYFTLLLGVK